MGLKFIGLSPKHVASINKFLETLSKRPNVDLECNAKILRRCGEKTLHRRSVIFNKLVLWLAYYRELRYHAPDLSSLLSEFEVQVSEVSRRAHTYPFRKPGDARSHLRTIEVTSFGDDARTDLQVIQSAMESSTALARLSECQSMTVGEVAFIQLREKDVMMLEESLRDICNNMFEIRPAQLNLERPCNSSLVNATNKLVYLGRVISMVRICWDSLTDKCLINIKDLCKSLMKELKTCKSFESNYCSNIIKHGVHNGETADMLLEMLMEDFHIYEDIFPRSSTSGDSIGALEYDDQELRMEWEKWLKGARRDDSPTYEKWDIKKPTPTKADRQMAFSMLSPTDDSKADFWEKPTRTTAAPWEKPSSGTVAPWEKPVSTTIPWSKPATSNAPSTSKRVTFWPDDEDKDWKNVESDNVKVDSLVDIGSGLEGLKLDSSTEHTPAYKFEPPKLTQSTEYNPFIQPIRPLDSTVPLFKPVTMDTSQLIDWNNKALGSQLDTTPTIVPVIPPDSDLETGKSAASDLSDVDFTDPNSNFSPAKRRDPSETEASDDDDAKSEAADLFSDDGSDAESVASVVSVQEAPPSKAKRKLITDAVSKIKPQPKPRPSLGPFPPVDPLASIDARRILKPVVKPVVKPAAVKPPIPAKPVVLKPATLQVPATTITSSVKPPVTAPPASTKIPKESGVKATASAPIQLPATSVKEKVAKPQTVSSTQVLIPAAEKSQAKMLVSPATSPFKSADSSTKPIPLPTPSPSKDSDISTRDSQSAISAIIQKIKGDARENEE
ncbi:UL32 [Papio ursinus cytomegalovirus]|uniref:UL32 n=1 Tax=Papiine betaherpesvirus 4 TaxID=2560624 RepID=A0A0F7CSV8_9BETA|nr:UL32 [Papio ursinus cytomegalovirus]AKG51624.1 UL32 [Papiine betaherpesvirus 4]